MDIDYNPKYSSFITTKWVATVASIWIQSTSGSAYAFGIYSQALKTSQSYNQSTLNTVSFFKDLGANVGILAGLLYSASVRGGGDGGGGRRRPWVVILCGALLSFVGYFFIWLSVVGLLQKPPVLLMGFYIFLASQSATFYNTANVVTAVHNFSSYRGTSVGIMKGFLGLSGAILIQIYHTVLKDKPVKFILMLALFPSISSLLLMWFVKIFPTVYINDKKYLNSLSMMSLFLALYLMGVIIIQNILIMQSFVSVRIGAFVVLVILLIILPFSVAMKAEKDKSHGVLRSLLEHNQSIYGGNRLVSDEVHVETGDLMNLDDSMQETEESLNLLKAMCSVNFWFLFLTSVSGMGSGLATVNNISQISQSFGHSSLETSTLISLWSICNFLGRFGGGFVSDYYLHRKGLSRPLFIAITLAVMSLGHVMIAFGSGFLGGLYSGSVLIGVCYGSQWSLMPIVASEVFGSEHMGPIFNTIAIASPVGTYLLSVRLVGYFYDKEASGSEKTCYGAHCFRVSFLIMASTTILGSLIGLCLFFRTRNLYKQVILPRLKSTLNELN